MLCTIMSRIPDDYRYGLKQSIYAVAAAGLGLVFSHVHELNETLSTVGHRYWPALLVVFCSTFSFSVLFGRFISNQATNTSKYDGLLWLGPLVLATINYFFLRPFVVDGAQAYLAIVLFVYVGVYAVANRLLIEPNLLQPRDATPASMRYVLAIPTVMVTMLNILFGGFIPLLLEGYQLSVILFLVMISYLLCWFVTRNSNRSTFANIHMSILVLVSASGGIFYFLTYLVDTLKSPQITLPFKVFYLSVYIGLYLSIPEGYGYTWTQKERCTRENLEERLQTLGLLLCVYNPFVYLSFLGLSFSTWYITWYALGSVALTIYVRKERRHPGIGRLVFMAGSIGFLVMEFGHILPSIAYYLPSPKMEFVGVAMGILELVMVVGEAIYKLIGKAKEDKQSGSHTTLESCEDTMVATGYICVLDYVVNLRDLRRAIIIFMQGCLILWAGLSEYNAKIQVILMASSLAYITEVFYDYLCVAFRHKSQNAIAQ